MRSFQTYQNTFLKLFEQVKKLHETSPRPHHGHGLDHDVMVAQIAAAIAPDERTGEKAWVAAMVHSVDHHVEREVAETTRRLLESLPAGYFLPEETEEILWAAVRHSEKNREDQSLTQVVLMDADRVACLQPSVAIRGGQYRPRIPLLEFGYLGAAPNPASTYGRPASVLDNLRLMVSEFLPQMRIPIARVYAERNARSLMTFIEEIERDCQKFGLAGVSLE